MKSRSHPLQGGIIAGEASGDNLGAGLMHAIRKREPDTVFEGVGGPRMTEAGCFSLYPMENLSVMGLVEVLKHLPELLSKPVCSSRTSHRTTRPSHRCQRARGQPVWVTGRCSDPTTQCVSALGIDPNLEQRQAVAMVVG